MGTPVRSETWRASSSRPREASQATDSGSFQIASGSRVTSGSAPSRNMPRQPMTGSRKIASRADSSEPSGMPA